MHSTPCTHLDHELGHVLHYQTGAITFEGINKELAEAMDADFKAFEASEASRLGDSWRTAYTRASYHASWQEHLRRFGVGAEKAGEDLEAEHRSLGYFDTVGGLSGGTIGCGHSKAYYRKHGGIYGKKEVYANVFRAILNGWDEYERSFPLTAKWIRRSLGI